MTEPKKRRPRDPNQLAKLVVDIVTGQQTDATEDETKNPAAVALGRLGGLKGGRARAERMSREERSEIARAAAKARWDKK
jgi:hypothetical protein